MEKENVFMNEGNTMNYAMRRQIEQHGNSEQLQNCFYNQNWDNSMDQNDPFESALSSMVSSPATAAATANGSGNESFVLRELIGRLGNISNSVEVSTQSYLGGNNSANTSCYTTPLNSPPKLNLSSMVEHQIRGNFPFSGNHLSPHPPLNTLGVLGSGRDSLGGLSGQFPYDKSLKVPQPQMNGQETREENAEFGDSRENSSVSEQIPVGEIVLNSQNGVNSRKRKSISKGKGKDIGSDKDAHAAAVENNDSSAKRSKSDEDNRNREAGKSQNGNENAAKDGNKKGNKDEKIVAEPPKDYIHVRARRGQATDAHSLAERVRREKISQRMKLLQDLVPGCNKVTGKAVMLDEIINYVQSLQRQVEFLSMKLATINPRMDVNLEALLSKDMFQPQSSASALPFAFHSQQVSNLQSNIPTEAKALMSMNHLLAANDRNLSVELPRVDGYDGEAAVQASTFWEDDLQSVVFGQNQTQNFHGVLPTNQMKLEL